MMKKNKYIIALLLLSNLFTGCEIGFLDNEAFSDLTREEIGRASCRERV